MKNIMKIAGIVGAVLLGTSVVQAGVVTNVWTGNSNADVGDNNNWTGFQSPDGFATTPDVNGDTHIGIINTDGVNAPVVSWGGQINNTVLEVNNTATLAQTAATLNAIGLTVVLNDSAVYNAAGNTMIWGQNAGNASTLTLNDTASLSAGILQVGKTSQGIFNQNGGAVTLTGNLQMGNGGGSSASRYNLAAGTVTAVTLSIGATDAGADGGTYFNFTADSTGSFVSTATADQLNTRINNGWFRVDDVAYASTDDIWLINSSVPGQTTLSLNPNPGLVTQWWTGNANSALGDNGNWFGTGNPIGAAGTKIGVIDNNGVNAPVVSWGGEINNTSLEVNNTATLAQTVAELNAVGTTLVLNDSAVYNASVKIMAWGQNAGNASTLTLNDSASLSALHLQVGKISQGIVNQNGGTVTLTGDLRLSLDNTTSPASRYNLAAGTVTVAGAFSIGGTDAGIDGGSYFNFTEGSTGSITIMSDNYNFAGKINTGQVRLDDTALTSEDSAWKIDNSVSGQTTLSVIPEPATLGLIGLSGASILIARRFLVL